MEPTRSELLRDRVTAVLITAHVLHKELSHATALRDRLTTFVINPAADAQSLFLDNDVPRLPGYEDGWLTHAEIAIRSAEEQLRAFQQLVDRFGGPQRIIIDNT